MSEIKRTSRTSGVRRPVIFKEPVRTKATDKSTEVNLDLSTEEVSAIIKKLVDEKLVYPVVGGRVVDKTSPVAINDEGCCVDVSVSALGPVSTIGVNRPTQVSGGVKAGLTKEKIKVTLPQNLELK